MVFADQARELTIHADVLSRFRKSVPRFCDQKLRQTKESKQAFVGKPTNACLVLLPDSASAHVCLDIAEDAARAIQGRMAAAHIGAPDAMIAAPEEIDLQMLRDLEEGTPRERLESGGIT